jgi:hypothetical protein
MELTTLIFAALPWLFVLACPLTMWWMMRGMSHGGCDKQPAEARAPGHREGEIRQLKTRLAELEKEKQGTEPWR